MSVKYNIVERKNPLNKDAKPKFYANAKADGEIDLRTIAKEIAAGSTTVSDTDVYATLNDLVKTSIRHLSEGKIVKMGDLGNFQITISSDGAETAEKLNASHIRNNKITFRPGVELRDMLKIVKYEKYKK